VNSSLRYFGCVVGFGFGVVWMTVGLGSAIVCLLVAGLGYGAVFVAERARHDASTRRSPKEALKGEPEPLLLPADGFEIDHGSHEEREDDSTSPLAAEAEYGWPLETPEHVSP
jgi:hypothetical protein